MYVARDSFIVCFANIVERVNGIFRGVMHNNLFPYRHVIGESLVASSTFKLVACALQGHRLMGAHIHLGGWPIYITVFVGLRLVQQIRHGLQKLK